MLCKSPPLALSEEEASLLQEEKKKEKEKFTQAVKTTPHAHKLRKRSHFGTKYRKAPPPQKGKEISMGIKRVAGLA